MLAVDVEAPVMADLTAGYGSVDERPAGFGSNRSEPGAVVMGSDAATPEKEKLGESELTEWPGR